MLNDHTLIESSMGFLYSLIHSKLDHAHYNRIQQQKKVQTGPQEAYSDGSMTLKNSVASDRSDHAGDLGLTVTSEDITKKESYRNDEVRLSSC